MRQDRGTRHLGLVAAAWFLSLHHGAGSAGAILGSALFSSICISGDPNLALFCPSLAQNQQCVAETGFTSAFFYCLPLCLSAASHAFAEGSLCCSEAGACWVLFVHPGTKREFLSK